MPEENNFKIDEGEALLQGAIDALSGYIAILDGRGYILKVNLAWRNLAEQNLIEGYLPGASYVQTCKNLTDESIGAELARGVEDVIGGTKPFFEVEFPFRAEQSWYHTRVAPFGAVENQYFIVCHRNITKQKLTERALRESEESYRILAQTASDVIIKIDADNQIVFINDASERVFGYKPSEMFGQSLMMIIPEHLREGHQRGIRRYMQTRERNLSWQSIEVPALHKDGHIFPLELSFGEFKQDDRHFFIGVARNISGRKQTEKATAHLAAIVKSSQDAIISKDLDGIITSWNKGAEKIYGYTAEEIIGQPITVLIPPHLYDEEPYILERIKKGELIEHYETVRQRKDKSFINISITVSPIRDEAGNIIGASKIARDITDNILAEEELREKQTMLSLAMQSSRMGAWERDMASGIVIWSEELEEIFGFKKGAFGQTLEHYNSLVYEADRGRIQKEVAAAISEGREYSIEFRFHHADGSIRWMEGRGQAVYSDKGEPVRVYGIGIDIDDRKTAGERLIKAERKAVDEYQALLSRIVPLGQTLGTARDLISIYRAVFAFVRTSMSCSAFFVSFYDSVEKQRIAAYVWGEGEEVDTGQLPPIDINELGGANSQAILKKQTVITNHYWDSMKNRQHVVLHENGIHPQSSLVVPMIIKNEVIGTLEVQAHENEAFKHEHAVALEMVANLAAVAIENVRLLEVEAVARQQAEAANRAKDEFLSVLSHELRTPLNAMLGWTRMMKSGTLNEARKTQAIETIERNARLQNSLIEDLLDVSRIISGKMRIEHEEVDFASIVKSAVDTARPSALEKNIELIFQHDSVLHNINGDLTRLEQIVNNLLGNAVKFTNASGSIFVTLEQNADRIHLKIQDTGIGISKELLPRIFDRFKQADSTTKRSHSGLGLGLTIVRHLTELHNGQIEVFSDGVNQGSTFIIELPTAKVSDKAKFPNDLSVSNGNASKIKGAKILLVDDDCEGVQPLQLLLQNLEAEVHCADSARRALEMISAERFDIMISDIGMPEMDGFELIEEVRKLSEKQKYKLPAVALTAYAATQDRERAITAGYQAHLSKPVNFEQLLLVLSQLLSNHHTN
jgi:PAS domain S-box-containing protein